MFQNYKKNIVREKKGNDQKNRFKKTKNKLKKHLKKAPPQSGKKTQSPLAEKPQKNTPLGVLKAIYKQSEAND